MATPRDRLLTDVPMVDRWLTDVAIGYRIEQALENSPEEFPQSEIAEAFVTFLYGRSDTEEPQTSLDGLPIHTLKIISRLPVSLPEATEMANRSIAHLTKEDKNLGLSLLFREKLMLGRLMSGELSPNQGVSLFRKLLNLRMSEDAERALRDFIDAQRSGNRSFSSRVTGLNEISIHLRNSKWQQIENIFLQSHFIWPVLAYARGMRATILPVLPAVHYDRGQDKERNSAEAVTIRGLGNERRLNPAIKSSAQKSMLAALGLWNSLNRGSDASVHARFNSANFILDFHFAQIIRKRAGFGGEAPMSWESAEAYFALGFLDRLFGGNNLAGVASTGTISKRRYPPSDDDFEVGTVSENRAKLRVVAEAELFERYIVPKFDTAHEEEMGHMAQEDLPGHLNLRSARYFADYAKIAFPFDATRHLFMRCPDLQIAWDAISRDDEPATLKLVDLIKSDRRRVLKIPPSVSAKAVVGALRYMNDNIDAAFNDLPSDAKSGLSAQHLLQSYVFYRASDYETGDRFWRVLWNALSGLPEDWERLAFGANEVPSTAFMEMMKGREYRGSIRRRVPDKIVVIGAKHLNSRFEALDDSPKGRLQLRNMSRAIKAKRPGAEEAVIGRARIILIDDDYLPDCKSVTFDECVRHLGRDLAQQLAQLSVFQIGFDFETAKLALDLDDWDCRSVLADLNRSFLDGERILQRSWLSKDDPYTGQFVLNRRVCLDDLKATSLWKLHYTAARALIGFSPEGHRARRIDFHKTLRPELVHDAQHQLISAASAARMVSAAERNRSLQAVNNLQVRLAELASPFCWSRVEWAGLRREFAVDSVVDDAIDHVKESGWKTHPIELAYLLKLLYERKGFFENNSQQAARATELGREIDELYVKAIETAKLQESGAREASLFAVASVRAAGDISLRLGSASSSSRSDRNLSFDRQKSEPAFDADQIREAKSDAAMQLSDEYCRRAFDAPDRRWYAFRGDLEANHVRASVYYLLGCFQGAKQKDPPTRNVECLLKYAGSRAKANKDMDDRAVTACRNLTDSQWGGLQAFWSKRPLINQLTNQAIVRGIRGLAAIREIRAGR